MIFHFALACLVLIFCSVFAGFVFWCCCRVGALAEQHEAEQGK